MNLTEKEAYKLAGLILEGHCIEGIEPHKIEQLADKIVAVITQYDPAMDCAIASENIPPEFSRVLVEDANELIQYTNQTDTAGNPINQ